MIDVSPEAIRAQVLWAERYRIDTLSRSLLRLLKATHIPEPCPEYSFQTIQFDIGEGWKASVFYDGATVDYVETFVRDDGYTVDPWEWSGVMSQEGDPGYNPARERLVGWRGNG